MATMKWTVVLLAAVVVVVTGNTVCNEPAEPNSPRCHRQGSYRCGECSCYPAYIGRTCECSLGSSHSAYDNDACLAPGASVVCSGRGVCTCGHCMCMRRPNPEEVVSGAYCECDNFSCNRTNGLICSGPDHGQCVCGRCMCQSEYAGEACEIPLASSTNNY